VTLQQVEGEDEVGETAAPAAGRRREIRDAAARIFAEKGYDAASIQDVADAVGMLKGSLYHYIRAKDDLLFEIVAGVHDDAIRNVTAPGADDGDALARIRTFVERHVLFNTQNLTAIAVFFRDFLALREERRHEILAARDRYTALLRDLVAEGQREGLVCPDVDPGIAALAVLGMTNWVYQWYDPAGRRSGAQIAAAMADFAVAGLACDPATHRPGHRGAAGRLPA
jgi:AcrR family transcriptional regulator